MIRIRPAAPAEVPLMKAIEGDAAEVYGRLAKYAFCLDIPPSGEAEHETVRRGGIALLAECEEFGVVGFLIARLVDTRAHVVEIGVGEAHKRAVMVARCCRHSMPEQ